MKNFPDENKVSLYAKNTNLIHRGLTPLNDDGDSGSPPAPRDRYS